MDKNDLRVLVSGSLLLCDTRNTAYCRPGLEMYGDPRLILLMVQELWYPAWIPASYTLRFDKILSRLVSIFFFFFKLFSFVAGLHDGRKLRKHGRVRF